VILSQAALRGTFSNAVGHLIMQFMRDYLTIYRLG